MRYSFVVILSLLALLGIAGAIGGYAYISTEKTVPVFRQLANHHERVRENFSNLERLINIAGRRFILFTRADNIYGTDLKYTLQDFKDRIVDSRNSPSLGSLMTGEFNAIESALMQFLKGLSQITPIRCYEGWYAEEPFQPSEAGPPDRAFRCVHDGALRGVADWGQSQDGGVLFSSSA